MNTYLLEIDWGAFLSVPARIAGLIILVLIFVGAALHKHRNIHPKWMWACFIADAALVLYLEIERAAASGLLSGLREIGDSASPELLAQVDEIKPAYTIWLVIHILLATASFVYYYLLLIKTGPKVLKGAEELRPKHKKIAIQFLVIRLLVFVTAVPVTAMGRELEALIEAAKSAAG